MSTLQQPLPVLILLLIFALSSQASSVQQTRPVVNSNLADQEQQPQARSEADNDRILDNNANDPNSFVFYGYIDNVPCWLSDLIYSFIHVRLFGENCGTVAVPTLSPSTIPGQSTTSAVPTSSSTSGTDTPPSVPSTSLSTTFSPTAAASSSVELTDSPSCPIGDGRNIFCSISTCSGCPELHTFCRFNESSIGPACKPLDSALSKVSDADKKIILNRINNIRRQVATGNEGRGKSGPMPQASNMVQLSWDRDLASFAQAWAQQCLNKKDVCRDNVYNVVSQIKYYTYSSMPFDEPDWDSVISSWYNNGVDLMLNSYVDSSPANPSAAISNYIQLIWAYTQYVGCGVAFYSSVATEPLSPYKALYICNFKTAGNVEGNPIYRQGPAASYCPMFFKASDGLCVVSLSKNGVIHDG